LESVPEETDFETKIIEETSLEKLRSDLKYRRRMSFDIPNKLKKKKKETYLLKNIIYHPMSEDELKQLLVERFEKRKNPFHPIKEEMAHVIWNIIKRNTVTFEEIEDKIKSNFMVYSAVEIEDVLMEIERICPMVCKDGQYSFDYIKTGRVLDSLKKSLEDAKLELEELNGKLFVNPDRRLKKIMDMLLHGYKNIEIAKSLDITPSGVCSVRRSLKSKILKYMEN